MAFRVGLPAAVLAAIGLLTIFPINDPDVWWLLRAGAYMVETRSFPTTDPFSGPAFGAPWLNHAWGFELLLDAAYRLGGTSALVGLQALFAVATFAVLYGTMRREGVGRDWALGGILLGALATREFWTPRPQVVTYLALAVVWAILRSYRAGRTDRLAWLPLVMVAWTNLHGGFLVGPALIGLGLVGEALDRATGMPGPGPVGGRLRRLALAGFAAGLATLVNPFHYRALLFPLQVLGDRFAQGLIIEWASPPFHHAQLRLVEGLVLLTLAVLLWAPRRPPPSDVLVLAAFLHLGLQAIRNIPLLLVVLLPILTKALAETVAERGPGLAARIGWSRRRLAAVGVVAAGSVALWLLAPALPPRSLLPRVGLAESWPTGAVEFVRRTRPPGPLFNHYGWGGYLIWALYPDYRVSIDGRVAVHGPQRFADYVEVADLRPGWRATLDRLGARLAVLEARSRLATVLRVAPDWRVLYEDRVAVVLVKREARP